MYDEQRKGASGGEFMLLLCRGLGFGLNRGRMGADATPAGECQILKPIKRNGTQGKIFTTTLIFS